MQRRTRSKPPFFRGETLEARQMLMGMPVISEFMATNDAAIVDDDGDHSDWVEILNIGDDGIDLKDWFLTDDADDLNKWRFPSLQLSPGESTIVFASAKDRDKPAFQLHTNFKLSAAGEYLALVRPDGITVVSDFGSRFPPQVSDVSFGIPTVSQEQTLVSIGASARVLIPTDARHDPIADAIAGSWLDSSIDDQAGDWFAANTGIGFEVAGAARIQLADSVADWSTTGVQGANNWSYGFYNRSSDSNRVYGQQDFRPFPDTYFAGVVWDWPSGNPPNTLVGQQNMNPSGTNSGDEHWAIRRYVAESSGQLEINWSLTKSSLSRGGNGVTGRVFHNGNEVDRVAIGGDDNQGVNRKVIVTSVVEGDVIDFVVDPTGLDGLANDIQDAARLTATVHVVAGLGDNIAAGGNISDAMRGVSSSAYVRIPFWVDDPSVINSLQLKLAYDDGFVAYLNGQPVASRNVVDLGTIDFRSTATEDRELAAAASAEAFDLSADIPQLLAGDNLLMLHGVNFAVQDPDFLLRPELIAGSLAVDPSAPRYFVQPTPGEFNGEGTKDVGPLFLTHSHQIKSQVTDELVSDGAAGRVLVPTDDKLDGKWFTRDFDDQQPAWLSARTGIGFELNNGGTLAVVANSTSDWSTTGQQGQNGWSYGFYTANRDGDQSYAASDFQPFPASYWSGAVWDWPNGNPPHTLIGVQNMVANGSGDGDIHWPVRRYVSETSGELTVDWTLKKSGLARGGNGVTGRVFHDGVEVDALTIDGADTMGQSRTITISNVKVGDSIDFVLDPTGADGQADGRLDTAILSAVLKGRSSVGSLIHPQGDIASEIADRSSSAYVRIPFTIAPGVAYDRLQLEINYDDGFIAYLNGQPVASRNVNNPSTATYQTTATSNRSTADVMNAESIDLSAYVSQLTVGENVLAIHAVNASQTDADLVLAPRLRATRPALDVQQRKIPEAGDDIIITTEVVASFYDVADVTLHYRVMFGQEQSMTMVDDGTGDDRVAHDGVYTATISGGQAHSGEMLRWYFTATDRLNQLSRLPLFDRPVDSEEYLGTIVYDPSVETSKLPIMHWFVETPSRANSAAGTRASLFFDGEFYDNVRFDLHGQSTRSFPKKSYDVDLNRDHRFRWKDDVSRMKDFNLLTNYADKGKFRNTLAYEVWRLAGGGSHLAEPVRVQQNGEFFGVYDFVEDGDERFLERLGLDPEGAFYKGYNNLSTARGNQKITRTDEGMEDLQALIDGARLRGAERANYLFDNVDIPGAVNFLASMVISGNIDCCHKNWYLYRDTSGTGEWTFLPWDVDLSFGRLWTQAKNYFDDVIYVDAGVPYGASSVTTALFNTPEFRQMYLRRVRSLMDLYLQPPGAPTEELYFEKRLDDFVELLDPHDDNPATGKDDADLDFQRWGSWGNGFAMREEIASVKANYLPARREYLYNRQTVGRGGEIPNNAVIANSLEFASFDYNPQSSNQDEEYVEIANRGPLAVDISDWQLAGGIHHSFTPGTVVPPGSSIFVTPSVVAFRARATGPSGGQGRFVQGGYDGHLSNFGESIELLDLQGQVVASLSYVGQPSIPQQFLRISEVMYNPLDPTASEQTAVVGVENDDFEYIELVNTSATETLDLAGVRFTEGIQFDFSSGSVSSLAPGERVLVVHNTTAFTTRYGTDLSGLIAGEFLDGRGLANDGETLKLEDATNSTILAFAYSDNADEGWPARADGHGSSLQVIDTDAELDAPANWRPSSRLGGTPGSEADLAKSGLVINEVLSHTDLPARDAIELFNRTTQPIHLAGYFLSDSSASASEFAKFRLPDITIPGGGYVVFDESEFNATEGAGPSDFALDGAHGESVFLTWGIDAPTLFVDDVTFGAALNGESFGRYPNGQGVLIPMRQVTLGFVNALPRVGPLVLTEVQYHPAEPSVAAKAIEPSMTRGDLEFIEVHNPTSEAVKLENWRVRGGVDYDFSPGMTIGSGETLVITSFDPDSIDNAARLAAWRAHYGVDEGVQLIGGFRGQLSNDGERIRLQRPDTPPTDEPTYIPRLQEDEVRFDDESPWPIQANGSGMSLNRASTDVYGDLASNWVARLPNPGRAMATSIGDFDDNGLVDDRDIDLIARAVLTNDISFDLTADGRIDQADREFMLQQVLQTNYGDSNLDRAFGSADLILAFQFGEYEDGVPMNSSWQSGDWNGDGDFDSSDLILAFQTGGYQTLARLSAQNIPAAIESVYWSRKMSRTVHSTQGRLE